MTSKTDDVREAHKRLDDLIRSGGYPSNHDAGMITLRSSDLRRILALISPAPAGVVGELKPNDIAAILEENADADENGLHNASQLAEKIYRRAEEIAALSAAEPAPVAQVEGAAGERAEFVDAVDQFISDAIDNGSVEIMDEAIHWNRPGLVKTLRDSLKDCGYEIVAGEPVDLWYPIKSALARAMQDERDGKPCGCIIEAGCEARGYHDAGYAADGFLDAATDAVVRLVLAHPSPPPAAQDDRLRKAVEALEPFADFVTPHPKWMKDVDVVSAGSPLAKKQLTFGDCRRAAEALAALKSEAAK